MRNHASRAFLKAKAREALLGHYLTFSGAFILLFLMQYIAVIPTSLTNISPPVGTILYYSLNFGLELFYAIIRVGLAYLFLRIKGLETMIGVIILLQELLRTG